MAPSSNLSTLGKMGDSSSAPIRMPDRVMSDVTLLVTLNRMMAQAELKLSFLATTLVSSTLCNCVATYTYEYSESCFRSLASLS